MLFTWLATALLAIAAAPIAAAAAETVEAVTTPRNGTLTICRSWVVYRSCKPYYKVPIPERVAVGDRLKLSFGSNPKDYIFRVVQIRPKGDGCVILSEESGGAEDGEKIEIARCLPTAKPATDSR